MNSVWKDTAARPAFKSLKNDIKTDVLIIGGGVAGILCAYELERRKVSYVLAESHTICGGITENTTAKITSQHGLIYHRLIREFGEETALKYFKANQEAVSKYRELCAEIDCDFEEKDAYVYSSDNLRKIEKELYALERIGVSAEFTKELRLPLNAAGAIKFKNQAQFNPLKFIFAISEGLNIYEHTPVRELKGTTAVTDSGKIYAKNIVVATHFPFINKHGAYFMKMYQQRSYVIGLENAQDVEGMYIDAAENGLSFRNYKNILLLGGGGHRTGKKGGNWEELRNFAKKYYPHSEEKYHFAAQDCMTLDGIPYIGAYSSSTKNMFVTTGFNKWGMTSSMVSAMILCDLLTGKDNDYTKIFSPSRSILRQQLALNAFEAVSGLIYPSMKRCPHLGCALKWNPAEHSWDCPCHGSRFSQDGKIIDNPAVYGIKDKL